MKKDRWANFRRSVNSPHRKDVKDLIAARLWRIWAGTPEKPGKFGVYISDKTFYRNLREQGFTLRKPSLVPRLSARNIFDRKTFARMELTYIINNRIRHYLRRIIFIDSACFAMKPGTTFDAPNVRLVVDKEKAAFHTYSQPDRTSSFEGIAAVAKGFRTKLVFVKEYDEEKDNKPNAQFVVDFVRNHVLDMAEEMRRKLELPEDDRLIYVVMDSAKCMQAKKVQQVLFENDLRLAGLPPKTPECNIIEVVWSMVKTALRGTWTEDSDYKKFFKAVRSAYDGLAQQKIDRLCDSYEDRVRALKAAKGKTFKFQGSKRAALMGLNDDEAKTLQQRKLLLE